MKKIKHKLEHLRYWKILFSPFKPFRIKFYAGKLTIGVPYFYPRRWRKMTEREAIDASKKAFAEGKYTNLSFTERVKMYKKYQKAVPIKVGFDSCGLGWKTKYTETDFRYEYGPVFTFVFFGYQIAWMIGHKHVDHYWECWLYYEYATDKTRSKRERIQQCRKEYPCKWKVYHKNPKNGKNRNQEVIDYYEYILKPKYLK